MENLQSKRPVVMGVPRQKGMSLLGWVAALMIAGVCANAGFKTIPHYVDFDSMSKLIAGTPADKIHNKSKRLIRETLTKRFKINNLREHKPVDVVAIERTKTGTVLTLHYVVTEHIAGNADLVMTFEKTFEFSESGLR